MNSLKIIHCRNPSRKTIHSSGHLSKPQDRIAAIILKESQQNSIQRNRRGPLHRMIQCFLKFLSVLMNPIEDHLNNQKAINNCFTVI